MVSCGYCANGPHTAQGYGTLTILSGFFGIGVFKLPRRARNRSKILFDEGQRFGFCEFAGDYQHNIIRLVKLFVESTQVIDRHSFNVAPIADRRLAVIMPIVRNSRDALAQH